MAESFHGLHRTRYCAEFGVDNLGQTVTACGFVDNLRNLGGLLFISLRDRTGVVQCTVEQSQHPALYEKCSGVHGEYVLAVTGEVCRRSAEAVNPKMKTAGGW